MGIFYAGTGEGLDIFYTVLVDEGCVNILSKVWETNSETLCLFCSVAQLCVRFTDRGCTHEFYFVRFCGSFRGVWRYEFDSCHTDRSPVDPTFTTQHTTPNAGVSELENEIDQIVYLLYNHTVDEIAIVEEAME